MNTTMKSIKLAIIALLGFSTACSTVKEGSKSKKEESPKAEMAPQIIVMYGVRRPVEPTSEIKKIDTPATDGQSSSATNNSKGDNHSKGEEK